MDMRLSYRISSVKALLPSIYGGKNEDLYNGQARVEGETIGRSTKVILDNVSDYYMLSDRQEWDICDDIPNWAPPLSRVFAEWNEDGGQQGVFAMSIDTTLATGATAKEIGRLISRMCGYDTDLAIDDLEGTLSESRWVTITSNWASLASKPVCGRPVWLGLKSALFISKSGKLLRPPVYIGDGCKLINDGILQQTSTHSALCVYGLGISFLHCKNVSTVEVDQSFNDKWHRLSGVAKYRFHILNIDHMKRTLRTEGRSDELGQRKALHICRGHFATYEDKPLFGKYTGTFWKPDHVRGDAEAGVTDKVYRVS